MIAASKECCFGFGYMRMVLSKIRCVRHQCLGCFQKYVMNLFWLLETSPQGMVGAAGRKQVVLTVSMGRLAIQDNRKSSWISHEQRTYFSHEPFLASAPTPACSRAWGTSFTAMLRARTLWLAFQWLVPGSPEGCLKQTKRPYQTRPNSKGKVGTIYILQNIRFSARILNIKKFQCERFTQSVFF